MTTLKDVTAVILAGGQGTRLRPLTEKIPKPLVPIANIPLLALYLEKLRRAGLGGALVLAGPDGAAYRPWAGSLARPGFPVGILEEKTPLGTGGAFALAAPRVPGLILGFNGDILWDLDLEALCAAHQARGAKITVVAREVEDPSRYGLLQAGAGDKVSRWIEKPGPEEARASGPPHRVNGGIYLFEGSLLQASSFRGAFSMEKDFFPEQLSQGLPFYLNVSRGPWRDIGTPESYLEANFEALRGQGPARPGFEGIEGRRVEGPEEEEGPRFRPPCLVGPGAVVAPGAEVGPDAVLGPAVQVGPGVRLSRCVVCEGARLGEGAVLDRVIVGPRAVVAPGARPEPLSILI